MNKIFVLPLALALVAATRPKTVEVDTPKMPLVSASILFPTGAASEPDGQRGATRVVFEWLEQGTKRRSAQEVSDGFLAAGARYLYDVDIHYATATVEAPEEFFPQAWSLMLEVLREPKLAEQGLKDSIQKHLTEKKARLTSALGVAKALAYGAAYAGSPEGASFVGAESDVSKLDLKKASEHYAGTVGKGPSVLFVSKSMSPAVRQDVEKSLEGWATEWRPRKQSDSKVKGKYLVIVSRPGGTQAYLAFAKPGPSMLNGERQYVELGTELLGGNGAGAGDYLLFKELRSKQGLTYHASMQVWGRPDRDGIVGITFGANDNIAKLAKGYVGVWNEFLNGKPATAEKLKEARLRVSNSEERERATVQQAMSHGVQTFVAGGGSDAANGTLDVKKYSAATKKWLKQDKYVALVFGDPKVVKDPMLAALGAGAKVEIVPETADWAEINAAVERMANPK